ncbi:Uncharacterised protein [Mycobacteroides abscessus subsp. abscessus]|nr:Uncharacterised protein [Mycobacteroides abscessus subsp. abscessus]SHV99488.1 Uncharacterised protein [Mycobacteroides abscessus subsp. abscessus]SIG61455.1 Uncharacterised protein [Mycobacteroides abscessus subsp. abscessus]SII19499.1 Uncharacterised protein [Mycobacteroides abscessus subsp. abscessus]SKQ46805.1 Uncharacterised protein [Mycobacteroides abscessus subsp. abscessus]
MGHANTTTTEHIYTHPFDTDDHSAAMAALDALDAPELGNVVPLWGLADLPNPVAQVQLDPIHLILLKAVVVRHDVSR